MLDTPTLSTISVELTEHILSYLPYGTIGRAALSSISQVNHHLCHLSQKRLFHTIVLARPIQHTDGSKDFRYAELFHNLVTRMDITAEGSGEHPRRSERSIRIASYVKRLEIRDDIPSRPYRRSNTSWLVTDPCNIYLAPLLRAPAQNEEEGLLPNLQEVCIAGGLSSGGLSWVACKDDMKDALVDRLRRGLLRGLELEQFTDIPLDLWMWMRDLEVLRVHQVQFKGSLSDPNGVPDMGSIWRDEQRRPWNLRVFDFSTSQAHHAPKRSLLVWIARHATDLKHLEVLRMQTRGINTYESEDDRMVIEKYSMQGTQEMGHIVRMVGSLRVLEIDDPRLDPWLIDNPPSRIPSDLLDWAPNLRYLFLAIAVTDHWDEERNPKDMFISLVRRISDVVNTFKGVERDKPLEVELQMTCADMLVSDSTSVMEAWRELRQVVESVNSGDKPAVQIRTVVD